MKPKIAVVLVNFNGCSDTLECLTSLRPLLDESTGVFVVDNASSTDDPAIIQQAFPETKVIRNSCNQGWAGGNNRGIELGLQWGADWVLLLNNDTTVSPSIFERFRAAAIQSSFSIFGVVIGDYSHREQIQTEGVVFNPKGYGDFFVTLHTPLVRTEPPTISEVDIVNGCAVMISRQVFERIGLVDERFFLICEETDFCLTAQEHGFRAGVIHEMHVWHKHSVSFRRAGQSLQRYYGTRNLWLLLRKHPTGDGRNSLWKSSMAYWRRCYHLFCYETENHSIAGATAITDGLADGLLGRYGIRSTKRSILSKLFFQVLMLVWRIRGGNALKVSDAGTTP